VASILVPLDAYYTKVLAVWF